MRIRLQHIQNSLAHEQMILDKLNKLNITKSPGPDGLHPRTGPPRGGGVAGASAPGPGGPKGARRAPSKKFKLV